MIGDRRSDLEFGKNLGMKTAWVSVSDKDLPSELYDIKVPSLIALVQDCSKYMILLDQNSGV